MKIRTAIRFAGALLGAAVLAVEPAGARDLFFSVGYKAWINSWTTVLEGNPSTNGMNLTQLSSDHYLAHIPNMSLRYKNVFISGSKYSSGEIEFPRITDVYDFDGYGGGTSGDIYNLEYKAERDELDVNLGAYVYRSLALTVGWKEVNQTYKVFGYGDPTRVVTFRSESETWYGGPTFGVSGSATLGEGAKTSVYGNFSFGFMDVEYTPEPPADEPEDSATYQSSEVGLAFALGSRGNFTMGYKMQRVATHIADAPNAREYESVGAFGTDWTSGIIFGLNLFFY
jgi:hypothetical protein